MVEEDAGVQREDYPSVGIVGVSSNGLYILFSLFVIGCNIHV